MLKTTMESHMIWNKMSRKLSIRSVAGSYWRVWSCVEGLPERPELVRRCTAETLVSALRRYCTHGPASAPLWGRTADLQVLRFTNVTATKHTHAAEHWVQNNWSGSWRTPESHDPRTQHQERQCIFKDFAFDYEEILPFEEGNLQMTRPFHSSPRW